VIPPFGPSEVLPRFIGAKAHVADRGNALPKTCIEAARYVCAEVRPSSQRRRSRRRTSIADEMIEAMAEIGGDGLLFTEPLSRRNVAEITDGWITALQRRGATRKSDASGSTLRDTLMEF
jgi:hypothetical protein